MVHLYINIVYVLPHINILVPVQDIVREVVRYVKEITQVVIVRPIMCGMVVLVYVIAVSNILVAVRDIVLVAELLVVASTRVAIVPHITIGMVVRVFIRTVIPVRAGIKHRAPE